MTNNEPNPWPLYVRVLAVLHVLSYPIALIAFAVLTIRAGWIGAKHGRFDAGVPGRCCSPGHAALAAGAPVSALVRELGTPALAGRQICAARLL
ncbi:MAG: hypothetical protein U0992_06005 [Planctomycetaceae bacterium]